MNAKSKSPTVRFLGGAGTVTGSKHLVSANGRRVLLDCGLFQGLKELRMRNWAAPPVDPAEIDAVVLSHAHLDHSGYLPLLARRGFDGPIYCTPATRELAAILLRDSAYLQEEQAAHANRFGYTKHKPAEPLYTLDHVERMLPQFTGRRYGDPFQVIEGIEATFRPAGHILGSATVQIDLDEKTPHRVVFSGDLGRWDRPILKDPALIDETDVLLVESTYGNRRHEGDPDEELARVVRQSAERGGALIIPAFAVGRTQEVLWRLRQLEDDGRIPVLPVYADSPMAIRVSEVYLRHPEEHDLEMQELMGDGRSPLESRLFRTARTATESKALNHLEGPVIIISASGMATGGRILHHLKRRLPDERTTVLLTGFQAAGSRGRALQDGAREVRMHGQEVRVRARVETIHGLSAHADRDELLRWLSGFQRKPQHTFAVHGESNASDDLVSVIEERLGWRASVPADGAVHPIA